MMPSRMRVSAIGTTEQNIPLARMYQAIASFSNQPSKTLVPRRKAQMHMSRTTRAEAEVVAADILIGRLPPVTAAATTPCHDE
jgi:hypothetical protein